jgi:hypothetical protein
MAQVIPWWSLIDQVGPAALDQGPRLGVMSVSAIQQALKPVVVGCSPERRDAIVSLALLWHDAHDAAHALCQAHEGDQDCDYVHALLHRREGDFGNAKYWFREVGQHSAYVPLAQSAQAQAVAGCIVRGVWQPAAMVDACATVIRRQSAAASSTTSSATIIALQRAEFSILAASLA